jgi:hypothetical protein
VIELNTKLLAFIFLKKQPKPQRREYKENSPLSAQRNLDVLMCLCVNVLINPYIIAVFFLFSLREIGLKA